MNYCKKCGAGIEHDYGDMMCDKCHEEAMKSSNGAKKDIGQNSASLVSVIIIGIIFAIVWGSYYGITTSEANAKMKNSTKQTTTRAITYTVEDYAYDASVKEMKKVLKSPSSASFSSQKESTIEKSGDGYQVKLWCDAENSYGAKIRSYWIVYFDYVTAKNSTGSYEYRLSMTPQRFDDYDMWSKF